jgi:ketosteroid isomerase-like protein
VSERNVEIVRGAFDAFLRGDLESAMDVFDPAVEWDVSMRVDGRIFHGHDGVRQGIATWLSAWEDYRLDVEEYIDQGDNVIVLATEGGRGKGSGIESEQRVKFTWTLADGRVVSVKISPRG